MNLSAFESMEEVVHKNREFVLKKGAFGREGVETRMKIIVPLRASLYGLSFDTLYEPIAMYSSIPLHASILFVKTVVEELEDECVRFRNRSGLIIIFNIMDFRDTPGYIRRWDSLYLEWNNDPVVWAGQ